ncbi:c-type cytochrome domain-containing protein [Paraflavitalea speifideaquila]|uniref:c-type cytochrome domain-containing protein n=1 Tax=Paraflavitalea speifideaquila TaxID=3076558 RepID=UPI0028E45332|nr:c-type cytochrome domain-containing protein [Paraflavitalea speifideiaquila]
MAGYRRSGGCHCIVFSAQAQYRTTLALALDDLIDCAGKYYGAYWWITYPWFGLFNQGIYRWSQGGDTAKRVVIANVQEAGAYKEVIQPLLETKCYSCHNKNKQKGGLRMDEQALLLKGGKNGVALTPGKAAESEMMKRLLLPREHDDHMPPKEKPQMSESEIALVHWWIESGASFDKK